MNIDHAGATGQHFTLLSQKEASTSSQKTETVSRLVLTIYFRSFGWQIWGSWCYFASLLWGRLKNMIDCVKMDIEDTQD